MQQAGHTKQTPVVYQAIRYILSATFRIAPRTAAESTIGREISRPLALFFFVRLLYRKKEVGWGHYSLDFPTGQIPTSLQAPHT